ncbi:TPA: protease FtsH-inhibitory lysogeny factor CIII [Salmonella enterica]|nr:protease FtsH-inhibitory lysogeny factor CIII [Salmonella enterica]
MNYALSGGGALFMGIPSAESQLDRLFSWIKKAGKWLKDTLNQKGVPNEIHH